MSWNLTHSCLCAFLIRAHPRKSAVSSPDLLFSVVELLSIRGKFRKEMKSPFTSPFQQSRNSSALAGFTSSGSGPGLQRGWAGVKLGLTKEVEK
jgi:hypothetical protein